VAHSAALERQVRRDLAGYYAIIENLDWNYGRVVETLEQTGLLFNPSNRKGRRRAAARLCCMRTTQPMSQLNSTTATRLARATCPERR
jgi:hypothetical protein